MGRSRGATPFSISSMVSGQPAGRSPPTSSGSHAVSTATIFRTGFPGGNRQTTSPGRMQSVVRKESFNSVTVFWLDTDLVHERLRAAVERLASDQNVLRVVLFGSFAGGAGRSRERSRYHDRSCTRLNGPIFRAGLHVPHVLLRDRRRALPLCESPRATGGGRLTAVRQLVKREDRGKGARSPFSQPAVCTTTVADVEDDDLLLRMVHGIHDLVVSHADPVEMLCPA